MNAYSPTGVPIKGTKETLTATQHCYDFERDADGKLTWEWGETEYDDSDTATNAAGEALFIDANGDEWPESQLVLKDAAQ